MRTTVSHPLSRRHAVVLLGVAALPCRAAAGLPEHLIGFWTREDDEFEGDLIKKGTGLYLSKSGRGAVIGSHIGFRIETTFDEASNQLRVDFYDGATKGPSGKMTYEPPRGILIENQDPQATWHRRAKTIPLPLRVQLGIDNAAPSH